MCMICFLTDYYQYKLRNRARLSSDRFEHTLIRYKENFVADFKKYVSMELCESHRSKSTLFEKTSKIPVTDIIKFFERLEQIYVEWIDNGLDRAIESMKELLEEKNIKNGTYNLQDKVMFRCRKSDIHLSHWDMFHIPFNKRYLINNQRYSLVGRPMLYLGITPLCALKELGIEEFEENCYISSFLLKKGKEMKIFDLRNIFSEIIIEDEFDKLFESEQSKRYKDDNIVSDFYKMILSSVCSFTKRSSTSKYFSEEYVLPQIVAEIVSKDYDGLVYSSTKFEDEEDKEKRINDYKSNIVIFTRYDKEKIQDVSYVYDKELYAKFEISAPIELSTIKKEIDNINIEFTNMLSDFEPNKIKDYDIMSMYNNVNAIEGEKSENQKAYRDTDMGKLHILLLYNLINMLKNRCLIGEV